MASPKKSNNLPKIIIAAAVVGGIAFMMTGGGGGPASTTTKTATKSASRSSSSNTILTWDDYNAKAADFQPVAYNVADRFTPLIVKSGQPVVNGTPTSDLLIPANFTGGEQNWAFTGTVNINGKWKALVENSTTGKDDYLVAGDKWKSSSVDKVTENILTLRDISGATKDVPMQADVQAKIAQMQADLAELKASASPVRAPTAGGNSPMNPFSGNIGLQQQDDTGATIVGAAAADGSSGSGGSYNRRNRGRGGRGGGRGGRGRGG